jgi:hypothetical protein
LEDGPVVAVIPDPFHPYGSITLNYPGDIPTHRLQDIADGLSPKLLQILPM